MRLYTILQKNIDRHEPSRGFILPVAIVLSLAIMTVSITALQLISQASARQSEAYAQTLATEASQAGIKHANACIERGVVTWTTPLKPGLDCNGTPSGAPDTLTALRDWTTSYSVTISGGTINSVGIVNRVRSDGISIVSTIDKQLKSDTVTGSSSVAVAAPDPNRQFSSIGAGFEHTCAVSSGKVFCWGQNNVGQLGIGVTGGTYTTPQEVKGGLLGKRVTSIALGSNHTCALAETIPQTSTNEVWCWGLNTYSGLGSSGTTNQNEPRRALGDISGKRVMKIALGTGVEGNNACAITDESAAAGPRIARNLYCWGKNGQGQLSTNTIATIATPKRTTDQAPLNRSFVDIAMGNSHTCGILANGDMYCWGANRPSGGSGLFGTFGIGKEDDDPKYSTITWRYPRQAIDTSEFAFGSNFATKVTAGANNTCVISAGSIYCWGDTWNTYRPDRLATSLDGPANRAAVDIDFDGDTGCATYEGGATRCWGQNTVSGIPNAGMLGTNSSTSWVPQPNIVSSPLKDKETIQTSVGQNHVCSITKEGEAYCWGANNAGQMGTGDYNSSRVPVAVAQTTGLNSGDSTMVATEVSAGYDHTCAIIEAQVYCWGANNDGQLGNVSTTYQTKPLLVAAIADKKFTKVTSGNYFSCAVSTTNEVYCWGKNTKGQLGRGGAPSQKELPAPMILPANTVGVRDISAGTEHACAVFLNQDEAAWCWGDNSTRQLGDNSSVLSSSTPVQVCADSVCFSRSYAIASVSAGSSYSCLASANQASNNTYCWGQNNSTGRLGINNSSMNFYLPTRVQGHMGGVKAIKVVAGPNSACAISITGTPAHINACWGANNYSQLATGDSATKLTSTATTAPILNSSYTVDTSVGTDHACSILSSGALYCWGAGYYGQLGLGNTSNASPTRVNTPSGDFTATNLSAGDRHTCAISKGLIYCWGAGQNGRLGVGSLSQQNSPTQITEYIKSLGESSTPGTIIY